MWAYLVCRVIPILLPGVILTVSNLVLTLRMDMQGEQENRRARKGGVQQKLADPFSAAIRYFLCPNLILLPGYCYITSHTSTVATVSYNLFRLQLLSRIVACSKFLDNCQHVIRF